MRRSRTRPRKECALAAVPARVRLEGAVLSEMSQTERDTGQLMSLVCGV